MAQRGLGGLGLQGVLKTKDCLGVVEEMDPNTLAVYLLVSCHSWGSGARQCTCATRWAWPRPTRWCMRPVSSPRPSAFPRGPPPWRLACPFAAPRGPPRPSALAPSVSLRGPPRPSALAPSAAPPRPSALEPSVSLGITSLSPLGASLGTPGSFPRSLMDPPPFGCSPLCGGRRDAGPLPRGGQ